MTQPLVKGLNGWYLKVLIATLIFPVLVLAFHLLLTVPAMFVVSLLVHFTGQSQTLGENIVHPSPVSRMLGSGRRVQADLAYIKVAQNYMLTPVVIARLVMFPFPFVSCAQSFSDVFVIPKS